MYIYMRMYMYMYPCTYVCVCVCMYISTYVYACMHVYVCMYLCRYVYMYIHKSICIFAEGLHAFTGVVEHHVQVCTLDRCCEHQRTYLLYARYRMCICAIYIHEYVHICTYIYI